VIVPSFDSGDYYLIAKDIFTGDGTNAVVLAKENSIIEKTINDESYLVENRVSGFGDVSISNKMAVTKPESNIIKDTTTGYINGIKIF